MKALITSQNYRAAVVVVVITALYLMYAALQFGHQPVRFFSLIDDGQSVEYAGFLKQCFLTADCQAAGGVLLEKEFGRFRPVYWILQSLFFELGQLNPITIHAQRIFGLGAVLVVLLCMNLYTVTRSVVGALLATALFVTSHAFTENMVRIGPSDPFQLVVLASFSWIYLNQKLVSSVLTQKGVTAILLLLLAMACLIRETSIAMLPVLLGVWVASFSLARAKKEWWILLPFILIAIGKVIARPEVSTTNYGEFYSLSLSGMVRTAIAYAWIILPAFKWFFAAAVPIIIGMMVAYKYGRINQKLVPLVYWGLFSFAFTVIFFPWPFSLERYLFLAFFGYAVVVGGLFGIAVTAIAKAVQKYLPYPRYALIAYYGVVTLLISSIYFLSYIVPLTQSANYVRWYAGYVAYEHGLVKELAARNQMVYLNGVETLDNWEVLYELPLHLRFFFTTSTKLSVLESTLPEKNALVLSSSSLHANPELSQKVASASALVHREVTEIPQIDVALFRAYFRRSPLQAVMNPPATKDNLVHYWELRQIK